MFFIQLGLVLHEHVTYVTYLRKYNYLDQKRKLWLCMEHASMNDFTDFGFRSRVWWRSQIQNFSGFCFRKNELCHYGSLGFWILLPGFLKGWNIYSKHNDLIQRGGYLNTPYYYITTVGVCYWAVSSILTIYLEVKLFFYLYAY